MPAKLGRQWQHPWLRVSLLLRAVLTERWHGEAWERVKRDIPRLITERGRIRRAGLG